MKRILSILFLSFFVHGVFAFSGQDTLTIDNHSSCSSVDAVYVYYINTHGAWAEGNGGLPYMVDISPGTDVAIPALGKSDGPSPNTTTWGVIISYGAPSYAYYPSDGNTPINIGTYGNDTSNPITFGAPDVDGGACGSPCMTNAVIPYSYDTAYPVTVQLLNDNSGAVLGTASGVSGNVSGDITSPSVSCSDVSALQVIITPSLTTTNIDHFFDNDSPYVQTFQLDDAQGQSSDLTLQPGEGGDLVLSNVPVTATVTSSVNGSSSGSATSLSGPTTVWLPTTGLDTDASSAVIAYQAPSALFATNGVVAFTGTNAIVDSDAGFNAVVAQLQEQNSDLTDALSNSLTSVFGGGGSAGSGGSGGIFGSIADAGNSLSNSSVGVSTTLSNVVIDLTNLFGGNSDSLGGVIGGSLSNFSSSMGSVASNIVAAFTNLPAAVSNVWVMNWPSNLSEETTQVGISNLVSQLIYPTNFDTNAALNAFDTNALSSAIDAAIAGVDTNFMSSNDLPLVEWQYNGETNAAQAESDSRGKVVDSNGDDVETLFGAFRDSLTMADVPQEYYPSVPMTYTFSYGSGSQQMDFDPLHNSEIAELFAISHQMWTWLLAFLFLRRTVGDAAECIADMNMAHGVNPNTNVVTPKK